MDIHPDVEEKVEEIFDTEYIGGKQPNLNKEFVRQALTEMKEAGARGLRELLRQERAKEEEVQQWISKGGVDYIDSKARLDLIEKLLQTLNPTNTP